MREPDATESAVPEPVPRLPVETIDRYIRNQEQELQLKGKELEIRSKEIDHNAEFANASLDAQVIDRQNHRESYNLYHKRNMRFLWFVGGCVTAIALTLIVFDKESILNELIKLAVIAAGSLTAGYGWGRSAERKSQQTEEQIRG